MTVMDQAKASQLFRDSPDRYIETAAGDVAYRKVGTGPDVLFVHGWPVSSATFRLLLPYLVDHVTCHLIDLPGAGSSRFDTDAPLSVDTHIESVRQVVDELGLTSVALVGHDSGGLIARHAMAGDPRLRSFGLIDTEQSQGLSLRFKMFIHMRRAPLFKAVFGWVVGQPRVRRNKFLFGDAFVDAASIDGEFEEFFLRPLATDPAALNAAVNILNSFDIDKHVMTLEGVHRKIDAPVKLVWGQQDKFFPLRWAREMVATFPNASLDVIPGAGLFSHEEQPHAVAQALLPTLTGSVTSESAQSAK